MDSHLRARARGEPKRSGRAPDAASSCLGGRRSFSQGAGEREVRAESLSRARATTRLRAGLPFFYGTRPRRRKHVSAR